MVQRLHGAIFRFLALRVGASQADELTQETFVTAWRKIDRYDARWTFSTWLFALAKNAAASHVRKANRRRSLLPLLPARDEVDAAPEPGESLERDELGQGLWRLAQTLLSPDQCSALWLRYGEDATIEEIAAILGKGQTGVRSLLFRARDTLGRHLEPNGERRTEPLVSMGLRTR